MTLNTGYYLQVYTFVTLILCGLVQYFTGMQSVLWIPFFLTLLMVGLLVMQTRDGSLQLDAQETIVLALYFSFPGTGWDIDVDSGRDHRRDCGI